MFHLKSDVLLHSFILEDFPLRHHVEEGARGDGDSYRILGFGLTQTEDDRKTMTDIKLNYFKRHNVRDK